MNKFHTRDFHLEKKKKNEQRIVIIIVIMMKRARKHTHAHTQRILQEFIYSQVSRCRSYVQLLLYHIFRYGA